MIFPVVMYGLQSWTIEKAKYRRIDAFKLLAGEESSESLGQERDQTSAQGWCTGKTQRDGMGREAGGGIGMGNTCKSMADSCRCITKTTTRL